MPSQNGDPTQEETTLEVPTDEQEADLERRLQDAREQLRDREGSEAKAWVMVETITKRFSEERQDRRKLMSVLDAVLRTNRMMVAAFESQEKKLEKVTPHWVVQALMYLGTLSTERLLLLMILGGMLLAGLVVVLYIAAGAGWDVPSLLGSSSSAALPP